MTRLSEIRARLADTRTIEVPRQDDADALAQLVADCEWLVAREDLLHAWMRSWDDARFTGRGGRESEWTRLMLRSLEGALSD